MTPPASSQPASSASVSSRYNSGGGWLAPRSSSAAFVLLLAVVLATIYAVRLPELQALFGENALVICKAFSIVLLALLCWRSAAAGARLLGTGMLIHSVGDVLIARSALLPAMAFFLGGHLIYTATFWQRRRRWSELCKGSRLLAIGFVAYSVALIGLLAPGVEGVYLVAIPVYSCALLAMAVSSVFYRLQSASVESSSGRSSWPTLAWQIPSAAALYVFSDSVIGYAEFIGLPDPVLWLAARGETHVG